MTLSENVESWIYRWFDHQTERLKNSMERAYPARVIRALVEEAVDTCTRWEHARLLSRPFRLADHELLIRTSERRWVAKLLSAGRWCSLNNPESHRIDVCSCSVLATRLLTDTIDSRRIEDECCDECKTDGVCKPGDRHCCHYMP